MYKYDDLITYTRFNHTCISALILELLRMRCCTQVWSGNQAKLRLTGAYFV